ncbi:MAG: FAD-binding domain-containing protein [Rhodothalassiaceae bacterium]
MTGPLHIVWFKRDLRVYDHRPLVAAAARGPVLPLFIAEPGLWQQPDMAGRHWAFAAESLHALRADLARLGQPLVVRLGTAVEVLDTLRQGPGIAALWSHEETGNGWTYARDQAVARWARSHGIAWHEHRQTGVIRGLTRRDGWARRWDAFMAEPVTPAPVALTPLCGIEPGEIPQASDVGLPNDCCAQRQIGGRAQAMERLDSFLTRRGRHYRTAMSSPVTGFDACSRLSPHLAWGTLSLREVAQANWARQRAVKHQDGPDRSWRGALNSFSGRLHWHCHFMQKLETAPRLEFENLHRGYDGLRRNGTTEATRLAAWAAGETGLPFVDACQRCLSATGWMNFRMRAMLMAVASYHLWLDWRAPGLHLARQFTDYEPGIHWPQVQMQSGTTGINTVRIYNPVKQGRDQDPDGRFIRRWLPELAPVPDAYVHDPWLWDGADGVLDKVYPRPIVDHLAAARAAREAVWAVRRSEGFKQEAAAIQQRHGSRRSGLRMTGQGRARRANAGGQLAFPLGEGG